MCHGLNWQIRLLLKFYCLSFFVCYGLLGNVLKIASFTKQTDYKIRQLFIEQPFNTALILLVTSGC